MANPFAQFAQPQEEQNPFAQFAQPKEEPNPFAQFAPEPEEEGFITGIGKSIYGGARDTGGSLYSAGATAVGANQAVVESAQAATARAPEQAKALQEYQADIQKRKQAGDEGLLAGIKNVAGATVDNPEGALQMVMSQLPNTAVALGAGAAGAATGGGAKATSACFHLIRRVKLLRHRIADRNKICKYTSAFEKDFVFFRNTSFELYDEFLGWDGF